MIDVKENEPLAKYTSLHVGGPAKYFVTVRSDDELRGALDFARARSLPFFILGKGSNTLFSDSGYPGVVIRMADRSLRVEGERLTAASGVFMRQLVTFALKHSLRGLEQLAGIPGTVGGAVRGNAGTWQTEISDLIESVEALVEQDGEWVIKTFTPEQLEFGYRHSIFKKQPQWIILRATFLLRLGDAARGEKIVTEDLQQRHAKQPYDAPSAGSIFKNPDKEQGIYSGALIEAVGLKGQRRGGAQISPKHANFIVNRGTATSDDILALIEEARDRVHQEKGIVLEPEIQIVDES